LEKTRYQAGLPRVNDGALLFLQTMLAKMKEEEKGGSESCPHWGHYNHLPTKSKRLTADED